MSDKKTYYHDKDIEDLLESASMVVTSSGKKYYHLPYWFEEKPGGGYFVYHLNDLPKELVDFIVKSRLGGDNPQPEYKLLNGIELTKEDKKFIKDGGILNPKTPRESYKYEILDLSTAGSKPNAILVDSPSDLIKGDPTKPVVEIWMEGYRATGESSTATMLNQYHADSFDEAMKLYMEDNPGYVDVKKVGKNSKSVRDDSFTKEYSIWACRLFDNETDARKSFG